MKNSLSVISLFCGAGGLDLGFFWEGFDIVWANDSSVHAIKTHQKNFQTTAVCRDINEIPFEEIPDADVIIGGPPCQSFSLVGQRKKNDPRGQLVLRFLDIIKEKKPRAFIMENVPGLAASHIDNQRLPDWFLKEFSSLGYKVAKIVLLATDFLVPQLRRRIVLIGCLSAQPPSEIDCYRFAKESYGIDLASYDLSAKAAIGDLGPSTAKGERAPYSSIRPSMFAKIMRLSALPDVSLHETPRMSETDRSIISHIPPGGNYQDIPDNIATGRVKKFKETGGRTTTYGRLHPAKPSYTINTYFRRPNVGCNFHYKEPRLITPREAMRFQSFPDDFELVYGSQDQRNALIGNAVPPLLARAIAWHLKKILTKKRGS